MLGHAFLHPVRQEVHLAAQMLAHYRDTDDWIGWAAEKLLDDLSPDSGAWSWLYPNEETAALELRAALAGLGTHQHSDAYQSITSQRRMAVQFYADKFVQLIEANGDQVGP